MVDVTEILEQSFWINDWQLNLCISHFCKAIAQQNKMVFFFFRTAYKFPSILLLITPIIRTNISTFYPQETCPKTCVCEYVYIKTFVWILSVDDCLIVIINFPNEWCNEVTFLQGFCFPRRWMYFSFYLRNIRKLSL